jgi:outer membrane protein assembly factor BamD (BamD/ComL family)
VTKHIENEAGATAGTAARRGLRAAGLILPLSLLLTTGCMSGPSLNPFSWKVGSSKTAVPDAPADSLVLRGDHLEPEQAAASGKAAAELAGAKELYRRGDYVNAERLFAKIANNTKNTAQIAEEARYYEADCLRLRSHYPKAADTYKKCLDDFPSGLKHDEANKHMFDIANYWLDETRKAMETAQQQKDGKRWFASSVAFVHWADTKPLLDMEGRAMDLLEYVHINDPVGPLGEKALFYMGSVKFFHEDYKEADHYFSQIPNTRPNSELAPKATELAIIAKQLSTGGPEYDGRKCLEARQMIDMALRNYPTLAEKKGQFLERQVWAINQQEADRDFRVAEFYKRTGHPGAAYFYFELVRRRYPGTKYAKEAVVRMEEVRHGMEVVQAKAQVPAPLAATPKLPQWNRSSTVETAPQPRPVGGPAPRETAPAGPVLQPPQALPNSQAPETAPVPRPLAGDGGGGR